MRAWRGAARELTVGYTTRINTGINKLLLSKKKEFPFFDGLLTIFPLFLSQKIPSAISLSSKNFFHKTKNYFFIRALQKPVPYFIYCVINHFVWRYYGNGRLKREHLKSSSSASEIIISHYHSDYGHQTSQDGDFLWRGPIHKIKLPFDHVILWDRVIN